VLRGAETWLQRRGIDAPKRSAELLLGKVLGLTRLQLYLAHDRPLDRPERAAMRSLLARRGDGEPVAYLLGSWSFRGLEVAGGAGGADPATRDRGAGRATCCRCRRRPVAIDLGTGSGAIALALAAARPEARVVAVDISQNALGLAAANVQRHGLGERHRVRCGSWWEPVAADATFDVVVSNPPYIDPAATAGLAADVRALRAAAGVVHGARRRAVVLPRDHRRPVGASAAGRLVRRRDRRRCARTRARTAGGAAVPDRGAAVARPRRAAALPARAARLNVRRRHSGPCWRRHSGPSPRRRPFAAL
jgi:release factor glutamine methyltransferase